MQLSSRFQTPNRLEDTLLFTFFETVKEEIVYHNPALWQHERIHLSLLVIYLRRVIRTEQQTLLRYLHRT
jgi:hypothetical protein